MGLRELSIIYIDRGVHTTVRVIVGIIVIWVRVRVKSKILRCLYLDREYETLSSANHCTED